MSSPSGEHSPEAYRTLFALVGVGLQALALLLILASALVASWWLVVALLIVWALSTAWSWLRWGDRVWLPTATGTMVAVLWLAAIAVSR